MKANEIKRRLPFFAYLSLFILGFVSMSAEMLVSRLFTPYVGSSIYIWSIVISVTLISMSLGYALGGFLVAPPLRIKVSVFVGPTLFVVSLFMYASALFMRLTLQFLLALHFGPYLMVLLGFFLFWFTPLVLLSSLSPFIFYKLKDVNDGSGLGFGFFYNTLGGVLGILCTTHLLIPAYGVTSVIACFGLLSSLIATLFLLRGRLFGLGSIVLFLMLMNGISGAVKTNIPGVALVESVQTDIIVTNEASRSGALHRQLKTTFGRGIQGDIAVDSPTSVSKSFSRNLRIFDVYRQYVKTVGSALVIGGGAYVYPRHLMYEQPQSSIDVIEIDPAITQVAYDYFFLKPDPRMQIIHGDGRYHLAKTRKVYDVIFFDAFVTNQPPYHLYTVEAMRLAHDRLSSGGVILINIVSPISGDNRIVRSFYRTLSAVFTRVDIYEGGMKKGTNEPQNIILVAQKKPTNKDVEYHNSTFIPVPKLDRNADDHLMTDDRSLLEVYSGLMH